MENELEKSDEEREGTQDERFGDPGWGCGEFRKLIVELHEKWPEVAEAAAHPLLEAIVAEPDEKKRRLLLPTTRLRKRNTAPAMIRDLMMTPTSGREIAAIMGAYYYYLRPRKRILVINWGELIYVVIMLALTLTLPFAFFGVVLFLLDGGLVEVLFFGWFYSGLIAHERAFNIFLPKDDYPIRRGILEFQQSLYPNEKLIRRSQIMGWFIIVSFILYKVPELIFIYIFFGQIIGLILWAAFRKAPYFDYVSKPLNVYWQGVGADFAKRGMGADEPDARRH